MGVLPSIPNLVPIGRGHIYKKQHSHNTLHGLTGARCSSPLTSVTSTVSIERRDNICRIHGRASDVAQRRGSMLLMRVAKDLVKFAKGGEAL